MYRLGRASRRKLIGLNGDLVNIVTLAIELTEVDFTVLEGLRSPARQAQLVKEGRSLTFNSRHLTGHAVDLGAWIDGAVSWDMPHYLKIYDAMRRAADQLTLPIQWGGNWTAIKDGPHFQLPWGSYPL